MIKVDLNTKSSQLRTHIMKLVDKFKTINSEIDDTCINLEVQREMISEHIYDLEEVKKNNLEFIKKFN